MLTKWESMKKKSRQVDNTGSPLGAIGDLTLMLSLEEWKDSHAKWSREESSHAASAICCYIPNHSKSWWLKQRWFILFNPRSRWQQVWFLRLVSLACRWCHLALTSHSLSSVHIWVRMSTFYKDTHHTGLGSPTDKTYFFEDLISKYGYIPRYQGLGFKHEFLGVMCVHNHPLTEGFQGPPQPQTTLPNSSYDLYLALSLHTIHSWFEIFKLFQMWCSEGRSPTPGLLFPSTDFGLAYSSSFLSAHCL